jgi:hypothetical protein
MLVKSKSTIPTRMVLFQFVDSFIARSLSPYAHPGMSLQASIYFGLDKKNKIVAQPRIAFRHKMKELAFSIGHVVDYLKQNELPDLKHWKDGSSGTAGRSELIINREAKELRIRLTNAKEISVVPDKVDGEAKRLEKQRVRSDGIVVAFFSDLGEVKQ